MGSNFQLVVHDLLKRDKSILLIAPTGLGKTRAVTGDLTEKRQKIVYAVPLRALGFGIRDEIASLNRNGIPIDPRIHHGDTQESNLFGEEVVITTYDQVVCGTPGLPLSLPLKAGHAVAAALLMARLILDEVHLAWGISPKALTILLGIIDFRHRLGLQTVVQTATLPDRVAEEISSEFGMELITVGEKDLSDDEGLKLREENRHVRVSKLELGVKGKGDQKEIDYEPLDRTLLDRDRKRIYFANTVERLQRTYDRLVKAGMQRESVTVLHNRMPRSWREQAEDLTRKRFGKHSVDGNWLLLTNQVAEAGLDISAPLVVSDPAPVDTLVQRAGRCARWFRTQSTSGQFFVIAAAKSYIEDSKKGLALPYRKELVQAALDFIPDRPMAWKVEREWINKAWGGGPDMALEKVREAIDETAFALNLFDRASQEKSPGVIASAFREVLSAEVAVADAGEIADLEKFQRRLDNRKYPETSSVSLGRAWGLVRSPSARALAVTYEEGNVKIGNADYARPGEILIVSSETAVLHSDKGLCFVDSSIDLDNELIQTRSDWKASDGMDNSLPREAGRFQGLFEHTKEVMERTYKRLTSEGWYRNTFLRILKSLEPENVDSLMIAISHMAAVAAGFHDLGKADREWQELARKLSPHSTEELIGRTANVKAGPIGRPHTPPAFRATIAACQALLGDLGSSEHLVRCIALAAARHHSSLTSPDMRTMRSYKFNPHPKTTEFVVQVLRELNAAPAVLSCAGDIVNAASLRPSKEEIPLALPNDDLFPIYALVGRAILMSDRESAATRKLEEWEDSGQ